MTFFISFLSGVVFFYSFSYFPYITGILFVLSAAVLIFKKKYLLIPVLAVGILYAFFRYAPEHDISRLRGKDVVASGTFVSGAIAASSGKFIQAFYTDSASSGLTEKEINIISDTEFEIGARHELLIKLSRDLTRLSPGVMKNDNIYANLVGVMDSDKGSKTALSVLEKARAGLNRHITKSFDADPGALISSITTGQRVYMSEELRDAFNVTGLAHILSISGTHFGLFSVLLFGLFRFLIKYLPYRILQRVTVYLTPPQGAAVLCLPFMVAYLGLSGWGIPAVRSFIMVSLFLAGLLIGRKGFWLNSLLFAAFVIVLWNPDAIFSLSFQLSFLAVLFIGFSVGYMEDRKSGEVGKRASGEDGKPESAESKKSLLHLLVPVLKVLRSSLLLSLAASLGTAPLVAYYFHYFSVISPLSNLIVTPLIGFILLPLSLLSSFVFMATGYYPFIPLIKIVAGLSIYLVKFMSAIPFSDIKIPAFPVSLVVFFYAGVAVYFMSAHLSLRGKAAAISEDEIPSTLADKLRNRNDRLKEIYIATLVSVIIAGYLSFSFLVTKHGISITYLDVGQGDAAIVELPDKRAIAIDTGRTGKEAAAFLKYRGKKTIDALVLSHSHPDHTRGADYLAKHFLVEEIWDNGRLIYPDNLLGGITRRSFERGDVIEGKGYRMYMLHPYKEFYIMEDNKYDEANNSSLVLKIEGKSKSFLFTGDVEEEAEENIAHLGKWLKSDAIKVPHHGGKTSASAWFFSTVSPEVAVISAGRENSFGHPHKEMLDMLADAKVYRTDIHGAVKITEKDGRLETKTYKDFQFAKAKDFKDEMRNLKRLFEVW
ncbi:MAG: DNA internalization-related competence protein ComEC/Rec2 [Nitrospirae bacterium]|nr:DNA internalization-related competence protein ComEC/Rec2 [Nitrospirota bacterium]